MAKKWNDLTAQMSPERQTRIDTQTEALRLEMNLAELRKARDLTQSAYDTEIRIHPSRR